MSVKDLLSEWEDALVLAFCQPDHEDLVTEMRDGYVSNVAVSATIRTSVRAGAYCIETLTYGCTNRSADDGSCDV